MTTSPLTLTGILLMTSALGFLGAAEPRVLILGDSITYGGGWATLVESGLRSDPAYARAEIVNAGLSSETVSGLSEPNHAGGKFPRPCLHERLDRVLTAFKPTVVLACYGMNDGIYLELDPARQAAYQKGMTTLRDAVLAIHGRLIAITPPLFSADHPPGKNAYDQVLDADAAWLVGQRAAGWEVIETRTALRQAVADAKAKDPAFVYAKDNIHPGPEGHRFIAQAVWAGLVPLLPVASQATFASDPALATLGKRQDLLKHAWLTATKHQRPGVPAGLPLAEADAKAAELLTQYERQRRP